MFVKTGTESMEFQHLKETFWQFLQGNFGKQDERGISLGYRIVEKFYSDSELPTLTSKQLTKRFNAAYRGAFKEFCVTVLSMKPHMVNETFNSLSHNDQKRLDKMCLQSFLDAGEGLNDAALNRLSKILTSEG